MTILAHPLPADAPPDSAGQSYQRLHDLAEAGDGFTEAAVVGEAAQLPVGDRYLFDAAGRPAAHFADRPAWEVVAAGLAALETRPRPATRQGIADLPTLPRVTVLLVGGGHVGQAVGKLAAEVGFDVRVLDDREGYASPDRFPSASRRLVGDIGTTLRVLAPTLTPSTYAVTLTRGHSHDEEALYHLAGTSCGYVGMIGSKWKIRMIFEDLAAKGVPAEALAGCMPRWVTTSARRRCRRSRSASSPS